MSSGNTRKYAPDDVQFLFGNDQATGFAKGTFIEYERAVDIATTDVGSDGEATLVISANRAGTVKLTLQQSSPFNDVLSAAATALQNKDTANGCKAMLTKDGNGTSLAQAKKAWPVKHAKVTLADGAEGREWTLGTGYLDLTVGGQNIL